MEVMTYLKIVGRYWWLVLLASLASTAVALALVTLKSPVYSAHARVIAQPSSVISDTRTLADISGQVGMRAVMGTFAQVFSSSEVKNDARAAVGLSDTTAREYPLEANVLPDTQVIEVSGHGKNPDLLARYINATVVAAVRSGRDIYRVMDLEPLELATAPTEPTSPVPGRDIPFGAGLGLLLGIMLAFGLEYMRTPRKPEMEPQIRTLPTPGAITPLTRDDLLVLNGHSKQEYLVRQERAGAALQAGRPEDSFPG